jgi:GxxExxY protein
LESAYEACLAYELRAEGLSVLTQVPLPLVYREVTLDVGYRLDLLVENLVIVEAKSS